MKHDARKTTAQAYPDRVGIDDCRRGFFARSLKDSHWRICLLPWLLVLTWATLQAQSPEEFHRRADVGLQSFLLKYWSLENGYLRDSYPANGMETGYWTFAQGFDAVLDGVERTGGRHYAGLIETFFQAQDYRTWYPNYYDDECWMALALMRAFDLTGETRYLETAAALFDDVMQAWDETCCGAAKGGLWWDRWQTQKATAVNAGAVIVGARLFERRGTQGYLDFARRAYGFWHANMIDKARHHVLDHINADGNKVDWKFSYNEGLMIGAGVELYRQTGEQHYLDEAKAIAGFLLSDETAWSTYGPVLSDGSNSSCGGDCHAFKGPAYRYLKLLFDATESATYRNVLKASVNAIWNLARNPSHDLFSIAWQGPTMTSFSEAQSAAAVMALNIYPALEGPYQGTGAPASHHEAEDAAFWGYGLEAAQGDFTGWGYIVSGGEGWDGQRVTFKVRALADGPHDLMFRYAARAGDAARRLLIDDTAALPEALVFPGTGQWSNYGTVVSQHVLAAGAHRITLIFDASRGSKGDIHLDQLRVKPLAPLFVRGDANADGDLDVSDAVTLLLFMFAGNAQGGLCEAALDIDADGSLTISDAISLLSYLFLTGDPPQAPFQECGPAPVGGSLPCSEFAVCE